MRAFTFIFVGIVGLIPASIIGSGDRANEILCPDDNAG
jgi:hypothetical protein